MQMFAELRRYSIQRLAISDTYASGRTLRLAQTLQSEAEHFPILLEDVRSGAFGDGIDAAFDFGL